LPTSSDHPGGVNGLMANASVRSIKQPTKIRNESALGTGANGELNSADSN
jgi:hypothetical protein